MTTENAAACCCQGAPIGYICGGSERHLVECLGFHPQGFEVQISANFSEQRQNICPDGSCGEVHSVEASTEIRGMLRLEPWRSTAYENMCKYTGVLTQTATIRRSITLSPWCGWVVNQDTNELATATVATTANAVLTSYLGNQTTYFGGFDLRGIIRPNLDDAYVRVTGTYNACNNGCKEQAWGNFFVYFDGCNLTSQSALNSVKLFGNTFSSSFPAVEFGIRDFFESSLCLTRQTNGSANIIPIAII